MKKEEIKITSLNKFEYNGLEVKINNQVFETDIKLILDEAKSHKDFESLYDKDSIKPDHIRLFIDENNEPIFAMVVYAIMYKSKDYDVLGDGRCACGNYYPIFTINKKRYFEPHNYQASICW